ncbi:MAG TPA: ribosomal protein S18-alanine N-acetyltransferase [Bacillota bacterium]|nr:ribosomal protein S18-alanine N-acetyltransferase [Bacillota bacterium]
MPLSFTIEPMTLDDLEAVAKIEQDSFDQPWSLQSFRTELVRNEVAHYLVARVGGKVVGYGGIWVILDEAHLTTIAVAEPYRRFGIGTALLKALMDKSLSLGARRISLEVRPSNHAARKLYEKFGFTIKGVRKHYYFDEDGLVMFCELGGGGEDDDEPAS